MTKKETLETLVSLKGIGKAKAEAIIEAGFDNIEKIQKASIKDLTSVNGVSESVATSIKDQLGAASKPVKEKPKEAPAKKPAEKPAQPKKEEKKPVEKPAKTKKEIKRKKKPELTDELKDTLEKRKEIKKRTPAFRREEWFRYKRLGTSWRRPDGITSKMRRNLKYRPNKVRVGFRGPVKTRGLHPSGFEEIKVHNVSELESINPKTQAARIGSTVGTKKRLEIEKKAKELDIRLLNL